MISSPARLPARVSWHFGDRRGNDYDNPNGPSSIVHVAALEEAYRRISETKALDVFVAELLRTVTSLFHADAAAYTNPENTASLRWSESASHPIDEGPVQCADTEVRYGMSSDLDAPFFDIDRPYAFGPLLREGESFGWLYLYGVPEIGEADKVRFEAFLQFASVIAQNIRMIERERLAADTDVLTGLPNRRGLDKTLEALIAKGDVFSYILFDLDGFKAINDTKGHEAGDAVLVKFGKALTAAKRENDFVGRLAGDEFIALIAGENHAAFIARVSRVETTFKKDRLGVNVSGGAAVFPADAKTVSQLYTKADKRMYENKHAKKDRSISLFPVDNRQNNAAPN